MGIIRGGVLAIVSVLLLVAFFAAMLFLTMSWSLNYTNVQTELGSTIKTQLNDKLDVFGEVSTTYPEMQAHCETYDDYVFRFEERQVVIPCATILLGKEEVINSTIDAFIKDVYFQEYFCDFWDCFETETIPFFLVSAKAQSYWYARFNSTLLVIALLAIAGFLLAERKSNFFILTSALIVLASLPFAKLDWLISLSGQTAEGLLNVFFSKGYAVFIRGAIIGAILLIIGLILKLFRIGFKISTIFQKEEKLGKEDVKAIVKEEVKGKTQTKKPVVKKKIVKKK